MTTVVLPPKFYVYAVVDNATTPPTLKHVAFSRQAARGWAETPVNAKDTLRVRRAKITLFES